MSKATQCAEAIWYFIQDLPIHKGPSSEDIAEIILRFYPEEQTTVSIYQNPEPTNSLKFIDTGKDE